MRILDIIVGQLAESSAKKNGVEPNSQYFTSGERTHRDAGEEGCKEQVPLLPFPKAARESEVPFL